MEQNYVTGTLCRGWRGGVVVRALDLSGVALAMRHRLQWFIHLRVHGLRKGDEPRLLSSWGMSLLHLYGV